MTTTEETTKTTAARPEETRTKTATDTYHLADVCTDNGDPTPRTESLAEADSDLLDDLPEKSPCEMKFTVRRDDLLKVLTLVMKAISLHPVWILSHVLISTHKSELEGVPTQVMFTCTNMETSISAPCNAEVEREGAYTIPAKLLLECVKTFSKGMQIAVEVVESRVHVYCGKRIFKLKGGMDASEFPTWKEMVLDEGVPFALDTDILRQAIKEVQFAAADDGSRPPLTNICVHIQEETLTLVASDTYRMAVRTIPLPIKIGKRDTRALVPVVSMRLLAEVMPPTCEVIAIWDEDKTQAVFQAGQVQIATQLTKEEEGVSFPDYPKFIPKKFTASFTVLRKDLEEIIKAFKPFAQDNSNIFKLSYNTEQGIIECLAESEDLGDAHDEIVVPVEGSGGQIIFDISFLLDVLKYVPVDAFVFYLSTENRPALITPLGREDYSLVIMPMS